MILIQATIYQSNKQGHHHLQLIAARSKKPKITKSSPYHSRSISLAAAHRLTPYQALILQEREYLSKKPAMSAAGAGAGRRIVVRSVSCRGVRSFVPFQKPPLYAAVSLDGRREKTPADPDGGENPDWDGAVFAFDLDGAGAGDGLLGFEVKAQVPLLGNKLVGTTYVPVADLGGGDGAAPRHVSYQVCSPDGKPNGTLSFAYAITPYGGAYQQPQLYPAPNGARPEQGPSFCCAPPPPPSSAVYPAPAMPNYAPHSSSYPPLPSPSPAVSAPLYPPLQDLLPPSSYPPPPPMMDSQFPVPNFPPNSSYPPPPALATAYPPPPASCTACSAPPAQYISSYPPPPLRSYPPPPPSGYPPPAPMNSEFSVSNFPPPTSSYPPPESGSEYPVLPRSTPSPKPSSVDRTFPYTASPSAPPSAITYPTLAAPPPPSGGSYYPPPGTRRPEETARTPYYYPPPGTRYS